MFAGMSSFLFMGAILDKEVRYLLLEAKILKIVRTSVLRTSASQVYWVVVANYYSCNYKIEDRITLYRNKFTREVFKITGSNLAVDTKKNLIGDPEVEVL